jgi:hypothetical protein
MLQERRAARLPLTIGRADVDGCTPPIAAVSAGDRPVYFWL